jgi:hypothetical protein
MAFAAVWGVLQLAVLGSATRSVRAGTLLLAVGAGLYGCGVAAVTVQYAWTRLAAAVSGEPLYEVVRGAAYTVDPFVEETVKVVPLLVLAAHARTRRQRGLTDHVLLGAAVGAGFGLLEALVRYGSRAGSAVGVPGGWLLPLSLSPPFVPAPATAVTSWLPAPAGGDALLLPDDSGTNLHLAWSAVAGLGVGLLIRGRGPVRLAGPLLVLLVGADHAAYNYDLLADSVVGDVLSAPFVAAQPLLWLWPLAALVVAAVLDRRQLRAAREVAPDLRLRGETARGPADLVRSAWAGRPWALLVVARFVGARRTALYAVPTGSPPPSDPLLVELAAARDQLDAADSRDAWRGVGRLSMSFGPGLLRRVWPLLVWFALLVPSFLYLVVGSTPWAAGVQDALAHPVPFVALVVVPAVLVLALLGWQLVASARRLPAALRVPNGEVAARLQLRIATGLGAVGLGVLTFGAWLRGAAPDGRVLSNVHVLDALSSLLLVAGLALLIAAFVFFPPSIGFVAAGTAGASVLVPTIAVSGAFTTTAGLGVASILLSQAADGAGAGGPSRGGQPGGSGGSGGVPDLPQRPPPPRPPVRSWRLRNIVDDLWKGTRNPNRVGDGTTMDAVRNELRTGRPTEGVFHSQKAEESISALRNWLRDHGPAASRQDRLWARRLISDLQRALRGQ